MTEAHAKRPRLSKRALRVWAWVAGGLAFFSPWIELGLSPKAAAQASPTTSARPVIIVRKITRRVIVQNAAKPVPVQYVSSSSGGGSYTAPPVTSTSGSTPPP